jgi:DNA-binding MarR family transcriptional regulator
LTRSLQIIERNGWVQRTTPADRRMRAFRLTPKGNAKLQKAQPLWAAVQARTIEHMGMDAWERIRVPLSALAGLRVEGNPGNQDVKVAGR